MLSKLTSNQKILLVLTGLIIFIASLICIAVVLIFKPAPVTEESTPEPIAKIEYCGTTPQELCLLSFGRNVYGNAIINVFVPEDDFQDFYLRILRVNSETIYVCMKNDETSSDVVCTGDALNLGEQVEIHVIANADYQILAQGTFIIKAILISPPNDDVKTPQADAPTASATSTPVSTQTPSTEDESD